MAIIHSASTCAICGEPLDRAFTATSGCAFGEEHPLWRFCDAPLHLDCLERWPLREQFSRGYFDNTVEGRKRGYGHLLFQAETWVLVCGPVWNTGWPYFAEVQLTDWPFRLYSQWERWDEYVGGGYRVGLEGAALVAADEAMTAVRMIAPALSALSQLLRAAVQRRHAPKH
jgi:hypothetical protein